jgi:hypothetical protein
LKTNATAVYIGKLVTPKKPITDDSDENSHIDSEAAKVIHYLKSTSDHTFMVDKILRHDQGLTFEIFKDLEAPPKDENEEQLEEGGQPLPDQSMPRCIYVPEVVREPKMHYYRVPKLGSYLAIKLEYQSCLFEESLKAAVNDQLEIIQKQKDNEEDKREFQRRLEEEREGDQDEDYHQAEEKNYEEIKQKPYLTQTV